MESSSVGAASAGDVAPMELLMMARIYKYAAPTALRKSGGGPPQSKTLARLPMAHKQREASWSAPALWRFVWRDSAAKKIHFDSVQIRHNIAAKTF